MPIHGSRQKRDASQFDLERLHPNYVADAPLRIESRDIFTGTQAIKIKSQTYLFRTDGESTEFYKFRLKRAVFNNFYASIIEACQALIWKTAPERKVPKNITQWENDIDMEGNSLDVFMTRVTEAAQVDAITWVMANRFTPDENIVTVRDEKESGARTFLRHIFADNVLDWQSDSEGSLLWAVIKQARVERGKGTGDYEGKTGPGFGIKVTAQWMVWTKETWTLYEKDTGGKFVVKEDGPNDIGEVPLVPFYGFKSPDREFSGKPIGKDILGHIIGIYNTYSDRDVSIYKTSNPIPWIKAVENPGTTNIAGMSGIFLPQAEGQPNPEIGYLETTAAGHGAALESEQINVRRIYEIALKQAKKDGAQVQAAESMKEDRRIFFTSLNMRAVGYEKGETRALEMWMKWESKPTDLQGKIKYNKDFDDKVIEVAMIDALGKAQVQGQIPLEVIYDNLILGEIISSDKWTFDKFKHAIESDAAMDAMPGGEFGNNGENDPDQNTQPPGE